MQLPRFEDLAASPDATLDLLALALAAAFHPVDAAGALATLDGLGDEVAAVLRPAGTPDAQALALSAVIGTLHGFRGDTEQYDRPENSMLDRVLERRRGLPILLSAVYVEVARRAGVPLAGVGLPGHYVVAHFGTPEPLLLDPFGGGVRITPDVPPALVRPWTPHETAMRMLNNLVPAWLGLPPAVHLPAAVAGRPPPARAATQASGQRYEGRAALRALRPMQTSLPRERAGAVVCCRECVEEAGVGLAALDECDPHRLQSLGGELEVDPSRGVESRMLGNGHVRLNAVAQPDRVQDRPAMTCS